MGFLFFNCCKFSWPGFSIFLIVIMLLVFNDINGVEGFHKVYKVYQSVSPANVDHLHQTGYHFQPKKNWINDPNGPVYFKGLYHLFYQYNPKGAVWGNIIWAHSVSKDMVNWQKLEPAIYPSKPFDKYGCWSGSTTILPGDKPVILYTGIINPVPHPGSAVQNYAIPANYSDPYLRKWIKPDNNPLIAPSYYDNINISAFRDPTTAWFEGGHWKILIGSVRKHRGLAYLYRSKNFMNWVKAKHPIHSKENTYMWECVDFFPVSVNSQKGLDWSVLGKNVKHVLKVSLDLTRFEYYTIGHYDTKLDKYYPGNTSVDGWKGLRYDYGSFYASKSFFDPSTNRRVVWAWSNESDSVQQDVLKGWAGIMLIPRTITLDPNGKQLLLWPIEEIETLRGNKVEMSNLTLNKGDYVEVEGVTAAQADVDVTFSFSNLDKVEPFDPSWVKLYALDVCKIRGPTVEGRLGPFGLLSLASKNLEEYTAVFFRIFKAQDKYKVLMCSDPTRSSLGKGMYKPTFAGYVDVDLADKKLSLRSLIDNSVVESFGEGGKTCITSRVYPTLAISDNSHLYVFNNGTEVITVERLDAWSMKKPDEMN